MYTELLATVFINKSKLHITKNRKPINYTATIGNVCTHTSFGNEELGSYSPDFEVNGKFIHPGHFSRENPEFDIAGDTDKLLITAVDIGTNTLEKFRVNNHIYSSYWVDPTRGMGYLFQIIRNENR